MAGSKKGDISEERTAAASYIVTFYKEVTQINHFYAEYYNLLIELEAKYPALDIDKIEQQEKGIIIQSMQNTRYFVHKTYIQCSCISQVLGDSDIKKIKELYEKVNKNFVIVREDLAQYVTALNLFLLSNIIQNLLRRSQELVNEIYD